MKIRYLVAAFFGALLGAACVLIAVYVTNAKTLVIDNHGTDIAINAIHSRINDFYIFAGIVITLLLTINVGVFIRAEDEIEKHIRANFEAYKVRIKTIHDHCEKIYRDMIKKSKEKT